MMLSPDHCLAPTWKAKFCSLDNGKFLLVLKNHKMKRKIILKKKINFKSTFSSDENNYNCNYSNKRRELMLGVGTKQSPNL
jgi:hypothetical protein